MRLLPKLGNWVLRQAAIIDHECIVLIGNLRKTVLQKARTVSSISTKRAEPIKDMDRNATQSNGRESVRTAGNGETEDVLVPRSEVRTFLNTLQEFSTSCSASRESVESNKAFVEGIERDVCHFADECTKKMDSAVRDVEAKMKQLTNMAKNHKA